METQTMNERACQLLSCLLGVKVHLVKGSPSFPQKISWADIGQASRILEDKASFNFSSQPPLQQRTAQDLKDMLEETLDANARCLLPAQVMEGVRSYCQSVLKICEGCTSMVEGVAGRLGEATDGDPEWMKPDFVARCTHCPRLHFSSSMTTLLISTWAESKPSTLAKYKLYGKSHEIHVDQYSAPVRCLSAIAQTWGESLALAWTSQKLQEGKLATVALTFLRDFSADLFLSSIDPRHQIKLPKRRCKEKIKAEVGVTSRVVIFELD
jgi:hypothetical protein